MVDQLLLQELSDSCFCSQSQVFRGRDSDVSRAAL